MVSNKINYSEYVFYQQRFKNSVSKNKINVLNINSINKRKISRNCKKRSTKDNWINKNLIQLFSAFFRDSSIYTLSRIGNSTTVARKIFWFIILIIGLAGCFSQIGPFLTSYYSYGVIVNLESLKAENLVFPAVTVCNINSVRKEYEPCVKQILNFEECLGLKKRK